MFQRLKKLLRHSYEPLNLIEISSSRLKNNYKYLSGLNQTIKVAPVLKSNAYGHGIKLIAKILDALNPPFFCVDSLYEAYELLNAGIKTEILIMGYVDPRSLKTKKLPFSFAVYDKQLITALNKYQPRAKIHIFVDTGMHREGISVEELPKLLNFIKTKTCLQVEGLMSHFGMSDHPRDTLTKKQIDEFQRAQLIAKKMDINPKWIHIANSSGLLNYKKYPQKLGNMARAGVVLYGINPEGKNKLLKPALKLKTHIAQIKEVKRGEKIGYDFTYTAKKDIKIAILPVGYYDGVDRRLSNKGYVTVNGIASPIIGRVSMNITTIDVSEIPNAKAGQEVVVFSDNQGDKNSVKNSAKICGTISYELLIHLASSTKRIVI